jgi:hypothetical protein
LIIRTDTLSSLQTFCSIHRMGSAKWYTRKKEVQRI